MHTLPRRFRQVEEAGVGQERTLVEMPLVTAGEETHVPLARGRAVTLADEPVLLVYHAVFGQDLQGLAPGGVDRLVLGGRDGEQLREFDPIDDRYVRVLADDTTAFHGQERELAFQRGGFQDVSHTRPPFLFSNRRRDLRLSR